MSLVRLKPATPGSQVKHSTTEPLSSCLKLPASSNKSEQKYTLYMHSTNRFDLSKVVFQCSYMRFRSPNKSVLLFFFSTKTNVVGTQKNCLNETVLLSTQNTCSN